MIRYDRKRRRLWVAGRRLHHGAVGIALAAIGALLVVDDWSDRWWVR